MALETSQLHLHSIGKVSANKAMSSHEISVVPIEYRFSTAEELVTNPTANEVNFKTKGGEETVKVHTDNSITAKWMKSNSNRVTPPDVRRGDRVKIYRLGKTDQYFWEDMNSEGMKRLETVAYSFNADPNNDTKADHSNAYVFEVSTHNGTVTLATSMANGEKAQFTIQLNGATGVIAVEDEKGNQVYLDSVNTDIGLVNAAGTSFRLNKKDIVGIAPGNMSLDVEQNIQFDCKTFNMNCDTAKINATKVTSNAPQTTCTGNLTARSLSIGGAGMADSGFAQISGKAEFLSSVSFEQAVTFNAHVTFLGGTSGDRT